MLAAKIVAMTHDTYPELAVGISRIAFVSPRCPKALTDSELGWLTGADCTPEFARKIFFGHAEVGVLPRLVHSRFGSQVVEVLRPEAREVPMFETVRAAVALSLRQQATVTGPGHYLQVLTAETPLVQ